MCTEVAYYQLYTNTVKMVKQFHTQLRALGLQLIPVSWQSACRWLCHKPSGRLPLLSARPAVIFPAEKHHRSLASIKLYCICILYMNRKTCTQCKNMSTYKTDWTTTFGQQQSKVIEERTDEMNGKVSHRQTDQLHEVLESTDLFRQWDELVVADQQNLKQFQSRYERRNYRQLVTTAAHSAYLTTYGRLLLHWDTVSHAITFHLQHQSKWVCRV